MGSMQGTLNSYNTAGSLGSRQNLIKDMAGVGWGWGSGGYGLAGSSCP